MSGVPQFAEEIERAVAALGDRNMAESPRTFPRDARAAAAPGLYAWWADETALVVLASTLHAELPPLIYAGQAGATSTRSLKESRATLGSRIKSNHIGGNVRASTFRHTLAAVVRAPLGLRAERQGRLDRASEECLTSWIKEHLVVAIRPYSDAVNLEALEHGVLTVLDPPLNLRGMLPNPTRRRLRTLRREFALLEA
jgi:hypothetical protein